MARPMIIGDKEQAEINRVIANAFKLPISADDLKATVAGKKKAVGDDPAFSCDIPDGFRCVFSFEQQPMGWCRHLSVSACDNGRMPSPEAMEHMLMPFFKFTGGLKDCQVWLTQEPVPCVEILQPVTNANEKGELSWNLTYRVMRSVKGGD